MFEGLVSQLLVGYLGRYVKDIQKEKLKITLWNEEVLLDNVELILEAFDYLQLPFGLKEGRVGRLSIKIPWKKLGWDPIIISLEDVYICASQRDDNEWSMESVEKREFSGKKAKLAAAELAKLSRHVCDDHAGQSFISFITTKVLDSIQVSIKKFHVVFYDTTASSGHIRFGLKFSSLAILKQMPVGSSSGWVRGSHVHKIVEILGLEIYCSTVQSSGKTAINSSWDSKLCNNGSSQSIHHDSILAPCDVSLSLLVSKIGKLDNSTPQYSINAELTNLVISLDEVQLQNILVLWDNLYICRLRDKYGPFRPWACPLSKKMEGWQTLWWHYAQKSVLSDVRKKLKKSSWRYLGQRLTYRRRYITLYKNKLELLRQDQPIDEHILQELELMEKESDIDDILHYRSLAENQIQYLFYSTTFGSGGAQLVTVEKSRIDERTAGKSRGWLNWLSRGMLGAGGTDDSSQFSGVVSDEVIKDICEATKFHPSVSSNVVAVGGGKICLCAVKFDIHQISAKLWSRKQVQVMEIIFTGTIIDCRFKEESGSVDFLIKSAEIINPRNQNVIILIREPIIANSNDEESSYGFQVVLSQNYDVGLSVKVILKPLEFSHDTDFVLHVMEFFGALKSYKLQHDRVLSSINGIENDNARLLSKAEYVLSSYKKVTWDFSFDNITINVPWRNAVFQHYSLVLQIQSLHFMSKDIWDILSPTVREQSFVPKHMDDTVSYDIPLAFQLQDLYDQFELKINDIEMAMLIPLNSQKVSILEKFSASVAVGHCLISDESLLKQFKVFVLVSSLCAHMSPSIHLAVLDLIENSLAKTEYKHNSLKGSDNLLSAFSVGATFQTVSLRLGLENDGDNSSSLLLALGELEMRYTFQFCWISIEAVTITVHPPNGEADFCILYSSCGHQDDIKNKSVSSNGDMSTITESCFLLLFEYNDIDRVPYRCTLYLSNADIHCYPYVIGLLVGFFDSLSSKSTSSKDDNCKPLTLGFRKFGFSNFFESGSAECSNIPYSHFPFVTIINSGLLANLESSLIHGGINWRKQLHVRDRKISSSKYGLRKGSDISIRQCAYESSVEADIELEGSHSNLVCNFIKFNINGMKVHFHDSSCIVGSLTLSTSKSELLFKKNYMDLLCSIEGLMLTSSWWTDNCQEILWGPSVPYLSPILNVRVRKESTGSFSPQIEINIGIQHVHCILPPEYLEIIIGYFTLSDWIPSNEQFVNRRHVYSDSKEKTTVAYKFEILDSILLLPVEKNKLQFIKLELKQLYFAFILGSSLNEALRDIPSEYLVLQHKIGNLNDCFNIFGRDLCLSFLLFKDDGFDCLMFNQGLDCQDTILISPLSVDVWVIIPCEQESTCKSSFSTAYIMINIKNCEVTVDDFFVLHGFEAILNSINRLASVEEQSKCFKSDVLQFLQLKGSQSAGSRVSSVVSRSIFTEVTCRIDSMVIKAHQSKEKEFIFKIDLQMTCSALLKDDHILRLNFTFSSLLLYSLPSSMLLVRGMSKSIITPVISISLVRSDKGNHELCVSAPSVDVWLHLSEWTAVVNLLNSYSAPLSKTYVDKSLENFAGESIDSIDDSYSFSDWAMMNKLPDPFALVVRSEDIGINFHIPFSLKDESKRLQVDETEEKSNPNISSNVVEGNSFRFVLVNVHSKNSEISVSGKNVWLKFDVDRFNGVIVINKDESSQSWPFFKILKSSSKAEISINPMSLKLEIHCDRIDVCLSHNVFRFWHDFQFKFPEAGSSQSIFNCIELDIKLRKISFLLSDGRWSSCGSLLDILLENVLFHGNILEDNMDGFISSDFQFNYCNIQKAFWESFVEPWHFEISVIRKLENSTLLNSSIVNEISLTSSSQLNLNLTESLIECLARTTEMIKDACGLIESQRVLNSPISGIRSSGRHAPYIIQNLTSLPLLYHVHQGLPNPDEFDLSEFKGEIVQPGASIPIHVYDSMEEQFFRHRSSYSSGCLSEQKTNGVKHHYISIQLDGTSVPSYPISMDLVGHTYFDVNFSKPSSEKLDMPGDALTGVNVNKEYRTNISKGFTVPVVFDVSVQQYSKLIRLYSTVILYNTTSTPLELRFDIPLSVSPKILDPLRPGEEFPLPLHLAEAGRIRFRPMGNSYLWSEAYNLANLLSNESKIGLRSIVCYPSNRTSDSFRCCISVRKTVLPLCTQKFNKIKGDSKQSVPDDKQAMHKLIESKKQCIHQVTLSTPLVVKNYLPKEIEITVDTGGIADMKILSEVETFFHHMDPTHDLVLELHMEGFKPSSLKFPRAETFCSMAKFVGTKFSLSETTPLDSDLSNDPFYITLEKTMDAYSAARELAIFVPFVLYNCTGISFFISESGGGLHRSGFLVPSCYDLSEPSTIDKRDGLNILSSSNDSHYKAPYSQSFFSAKNEISARDDARSHSGGILLKSLILTSSLANNCEKSNKEVSECRNTLTYSSNSSIQRHAKDCKSVGFEHGKVKPCMYSPNFSSSSNEVIIRACNSTHEYGKQKVTSSSWSAPFYLIPPSGSTTVLVPQSTPNAAYVISVTAAGTFSGMTNAITFQPRFIISNACSKDLCYKQKGTEVVFHLSRGEHSHLQWTDTIRELLVSVCYNEPGWQWSGGFLPDHLGDTQIKTRNYVTGALNIIRVEVQNADISVEDEKIVGSINGNSATNLILLSDDDTGYMPYRIDNFSKERLRIYQQSCESFETIVHSYTSCPYAWDEPYCPHRLNVEVPGEQFLGSYALDDVKEYMSVCLSSTGEKPERILHLSVHAEGATKVLSIVDSSYHTLNNVKNPSISHLQEKSKHGEKQEKLVDYKDKFSIFIPHIGVSLINSYPEELVFACAKNITVNMLQSLDRQKFSLKILSLQIDNQLRDTPYPVILCFEHESKIDAVDVLKSSATSRRERILEMANGKSFESVFCLTMSKWRKTEVSLISFEHINLRIADFRIEIEQQVILRLFEFFKKVVSKLQSRMSPFSDHFIPPLFYDTNVCKEFLDNGPACEYFGTGEARVQFLDIPSFNEIQKDSLSLPSIVPIGAPWQQIYLLARRQKKVYVESFNVAPIKLTLSFSSAPWTLHNRVLTSGELFLHRGLMALGDVEGARIHLKQLSISHHMASWESVQEILSRHYTRQILHEIYKVFGSAGVIGNPMGFARSLGVGIRDFLSEPAKSIFQSPTGFFTGMAHGTSSLLSNTVYAISDAATQFSKSAQKGIVAFTFDDRAVNRVGKQQIGASTPSEGVINEVLEGLTGLLQSPIRGAEKHGLPGVFSGIALGITGLVAKPAASILQVTGRTAQSIRNRTTLYKTGQQRFRTRLPRPLSRDLPLRPFTWEEAVGASVILDTGDGFKLKDEVLVICKALKQAGKFVVITETLILVVSSSSLVDLGKPEFRGVGLDVEWVVDSEVGLESVIHVDVDGEIVHIVGSSSDVLSKQNQIPPKGVGGMRSARWNGPTRLPLFQTNLELTCKEEAELLMQVLLSTIESTKQRCWGGGYVLHQHSIK